MATVEEDPSSEGCSLEKFDPDETIVRFVVDNITSNFANGLSDLKIAAALYDSINTKRCEQEIKLRSANENETLGASSAIEECEAASQRIEELADKLTSIAQNLQSLLDKAKDLRATYKEKIDQVSQLEKLQKYLEWLSNFENISTELEDDIQRGKRQSAVFGFQELVDLWEKCKGTQCRNLRSYFKYSILYWHNLLQDHIGGEFDSCLQPLNWPNVSPSNQIPTATNVSNEAKFEMLLGLLLQIQLPTG